MKMRHARKITCQGPIVRQTSSQASKLNHYVGSKELQEMLQTKKAGRKPSLPPLGDAQ